MLRLLSVAKCQANPWDRERARATCKYVRLFQAGSGFYEAQVEKEVGTGNVMYNQWKHGLWLADGLSWICPQVTGSCALS